MNDCIVIYILGIFDCNLSLYMCIKYVIGHPYATGPCIRLITNVIFKRKPFDKAFLHSCSCFIINSILKRYTDIFIIKDGRIFNKHTGTLRETSCRARLTTLIFPTYKSMSACTVLFESAHMLNIESRSLRLTAM